MKREQAIEIAAQCWCDKRTEHMEMAPALVEVFADKLVEHTQTSTTNELLKLLTDQTKVLSTIVVGTMMHNQCVLDKLMSGEIKQ